MFTHRLSRPLLIMAIGAGSLAVLWGTLLMYPGWLPISVRALTFGMCTPAIWEIVERMNLTQTVRYVESPNSVASILAMLGLSAFGIYLGVKQFLQQPYTDLSSHQRQFIKQIRAEGLSLDKELVADIKYIQKFLAANDDYIQSLGDARKKLEESVGTDKVNMVISVLLDRNSEMQNEATDLKRRLTNSQKQVEDLRTKLSKALDESMRDPLTDLGNRRRFDVTMAQEIAEAQIKSSQLSLIICDLDHFKRINDRFGHQVGDSILQLFANLLGNSIRGRDTAVRYGGEEFAIILPGTDIDGAKQLIENIRRDLDAANWRVTNTRQPIGKITASFGVAEYEHHESLQQLVLKADRRLYLAKRNGRNRVEHMSDT